jgi:hypothetical protein
MYLRQVVKEIQMQLKERIKVNEIFSGNPNLPKSGYRNNHNADLSPCAIIMRW